MADPIKISAYIKTLGLSGDKAELKRKELEKLSLEELNMLISGKKAAQDMATWGLENLKSSPKYSGEQLFNYSNDKGIMGWQVNDQTPSKSKNYTPLEQKELRTFAGDFLYNSTVNAYNSVDNFGKEIGTLSFQNGVNNFKALVGAETSYELENRLSDEVKKTEALKNTTNSAGKFEFKFEKDRKIPYNPENIEKLKQKSEEYTRVTAFQEKYDMLNEGLKHVKNVYAKEMALDAARARGQSIPAQKENFQEAFLNVLDGFCNGDENLRNEYIKKISQGITNKKELDKNFMSCLEKLQIDCKKALDDELGGKSYEEHTKQYNAVCKAAIGSEDAEKLAKIYIENAKQYAAYAEIGTTITMSLLMPGSSIVGSMGQKLMLNFGSKATAQMMKAGRTFSMASMPAAFTAVDALTSEKGFTEEKTMEIVSKWKNGLFYGGLGAYVSGPIGNTVEGLLKTKPLAITNVIKGAFSDKGLNNAAKAGGIAAETTADVVLDIITQNGDIMSSLETNGGMNIGMMIAGGRLSKMFNHNMPNTTVQKNTDGTYSIKNADGKLIFKAEDENILTTFLLGKATENSHGELPLKSELRSTRDGEALAAKARFDVAAGDADLTMENPAKAAAQKLQDKVSLRVDVEKSNQNFPSAPLRYDAPSKDYINVIRHFDPKVMDNHYQKIGDKINEIMKKHSKELEDMGSNFANDKQVFAETYAKMLADEFGLKDLLPEIKYKETGSNDGYWNWTIGQLIINEKITDPKVAAKIISHEFIHVLQYKDILTKYGEDGLEQLCKPEKDPDIYKQILNLPYTQKLLQYGKENPHAKNSLDDYMSRIYSDEMSDYKGSGAEYINQLVEQEAYYLGNNRAHRAYYEEVHKQNDAMLSEMRNKFKARFLNGGQSESKQLNVDEPELSENYQINQDGTITRNIPAGRRAFDPAVPLKTVSRFAAENGISAYMMQRYISGGLFTVDANGKIDMQSPETIKGLAHLSDPNLKSREEIAELLGIVPESVSGLVRSGKLVQDITNKYDIENEQNKDFISGNIISEVPERVTRGALSKMLGINQHTIDYHIEKSRIRVNADGRIDLNDEVNRDFIESYEKGERKPKASEIITEENIQKYLGNIPLQYCLDNKLLIADENGKIDLESEVNKNFLEKCKKKEITIYDFVISKAAFARQISSTELTITRAIMDGKIITEENGRIDINNPKNAEYLKSFSAEAKANPNMKSVFEVCELLRLKSSAALQYHINNGRLVKELNGMIDVTKEPNKSFIEAKLVGTLMKQSENVKPDEVVKPDENSQINIRNQSEIAERLGVTQATVSWYVAHGVLVSLGRGRIDITDPKNAYFLKNFKKGERLTPYEETIKPYAPPEKVIPKELDPTQVTLKAFAQMAGITPTPLLYHIKRGKVVRGENGKIDINNPKNREFLQKYLDAAQEKYDNMSAEELTNAKDGLKNSLQPFISRETYVEAKRISDISKDELNNYIAVEMQKIVDTENLDVTEESTLVEVFKELINKRIENKSLPGDFSDVAVVSLSSRYEIDSFKNLLTRLSEPEKAPKEIVSKEVRNGFEVAITSDDAFDKLVTSFKADLETQINTMRLIQNNETYSTPKIAESYLYNRFLILKSKGDSELNIFYRQAAIDGKKNPLARLGKLKIDDVVEKILYKERNVPNNNPEFEKFKKCFDLKKLGESIEVIKSQYKDNFYEKVCNEDALNLLKEANPVVEVTKENLQAVISEKWGLQSEFSSSKILETARYKERKGRKIAHETEMKEYIEVFRSVENIKIYNELVLLYNQYCGLSRNDDVAKEILDCLKSTDIDGKLNKESLLANKDIVKDIIKTYYKKNKTPNEIEVSNLKAEYQEFEVICEGFKELMINAGLPKADEITPENVNKAKLFLGIMDKYAPDVEVENIQNVLENLAEDAGAKSSDIADIFDSEPIQSKDEFISLLANKNNGQKLKERVVMHREWQQNTREDVNINSHEYYALRCKMGLEPNQIISEKTNLLEALNLESFDDLEDFLASHVPSGVGEKAKFFYSVLRQKDVDGLKSYLSEHKINDLKIKTSMFSKTKITASKNSHKVYKNSDALLSASVYFKGKNASVEQSFKDITEIFENMNGPITLKNESLAESQPLITKNVIDEIEKRVLFQAGKYDTQHKNVEYPNVLNKLGIDAESLIPDEIQYRLYNLDTSQEIVMEKLLTVLNSKVFDKSIAGLHCKMRFIERFLLQDNVNLSNQKDCEDYIEAFNSDVKKQLDNNVNIDIFQSGADGSVIAPKFKVNGSKRTYTITLNNEQKIHTIF